MVERLPTEIVRGNSIRVLATHACQERCFFCHNEGAIDYVHAPIDIEEIVEFSRKARDEFGLNVVHLTGGEPTLHPQIVELTKSLKDADFQVRMTTNGDLEPELLDKIIDAGVDSINFSLHAITPEDFQATQALSNLRKKPDYFSFLIDRKLSNISRARLRTNVKLNSVVINSEITGRLIDYALKEQIPLRLMRNLNNIEESDFLIEKLLSERGLKPIREQIAKGDSGGSGTVYGYTDSEGKEAEVKVKKFGTVYLESICDGCVLRDTPRCRERFYGMRVGVNPQTHETEVGLCIDREDGEASVSPEQIFKGRHYEALKKNYGA